MNLILTMAGKYTRFKEEGYNIPKYLLPWGSSTILFNVLSHFRKIRIDKFVSASTYEEINVFLVINKADEAFLPHIKKTMWVFGIPSENLILVDNTSGQAETAYLAINHFRDKLMNAPLLIHNIDTLLNNRNHKQIKEQLSQFTGYIDVFKSNNHEYSYVLTEGKYVKTIAEKTLISDMATSGLYGFGYPELFLKYYTGEVYVSEVYKNMLKDGHQIVVSDLHDENDTIVLGTPKEYLKQSQNL